jgi:superfamily I DNA/RNA helicase
MIEKQIDYLTYKDLRDKITNQILAENHNKKIVLAGPGTGKSFLFEKICKLNLSKGYNNNLVLTFINELVDDLSKDLDKLASVNTLHSFALSLLPGNKRIFIKLGEIIGEDYTAIYDDAIDYNNIFCNLFDENEKLDFYSKRRKSYDFFSPNCSIYTLIKLFEINPDKVPIYSQILVDEFQDFNRLESKLIEFLAHKNSIILVGDDDQSLYDFKYANPNDIRSKYIDGNYKAYTLPYCSRCSKVIVEAFNQVVKKAQADGLLKERVAKEFIYFPSEVKDALSNIHNKIIVKKEVFQNNIAFHIEGEIKKNFDPRSEYLPSLLIICPLRSQIEPLEKALKKKGFKNIDASQKNQVDLIIEAINLLLDDSKCNLGWRIIFKYLCDNSQNPIRFKEVIRNSVSLDKPIIELLNAEEKRYIRKIVAISRKIRDSKVVTDEEYNLVLDFFHYNAHEIAANEIKNSLAQERIAKNIYKNTPIKIVTILGSKGLTTDYAFLVNFDDRYLLDHSTDRKGTITDVSICKFLVALTRAKMKIYVFTSESNLPTYLKWIGSELIEEQLQ